MPSQKRTNTTCLLLRKWLSTSMAWSRPWKPSSFRCGTPTAPNWTKLKGNSTASEVRCFQETKMRLRSYSKFISRLKSTFNKNATGKKRRTLRNLRQCVVRTPTTKLNRKSSWRRKCRFLRSAWKTWKLCSDLTRRNWTSTKKYCSTEKKQTRRTNLI